MKRASLCIARPIERSPSQSVDMSAFDSATPLGLQQAQIVTYFNVASVVVLVHDWFLTIDSEFAFVWSQKWNLGTILYFFTRYPAFVDTAVHLYGATGYSMPVSVCNLVMSVSSWMFLFGVGFSEVIIILCVWAMWGRRRWMSIFLASLSLAVGTVVVIVGLRQYRSSAQYIPQKYLPPNVSGCQTTTGAGRSILYVDFIMLVLLEGVLFILMLYKAVQQNRGRSSTFVLECFRHGLLYCVVLSVLSIINLAITLLAIHEFTNLLISIQRAFHAILSARMLLYLRSSANQMSGNTTNASLGGEIMFRAMSHSMDDEWGDTG
ncbi:hypothetical protein BD779DRAFT_105858 [Infundibulicybe gibba]|nr:hypothetical protein BD779DRAFT_105858 [Infundibulicybe gibba]